MFKNIFGKKEITEPHPTLAEEEEEDLIIGNPLINEELVLIEIEPSINDIVESLEPDKDNHDVGLESYYVSGSLDITNEELYYDVNILGYSDRNEQRAIFEAITPIYLDLQNDTILDIGCGTGDYYAYIEEVLGFKRPHYTGIDYNEDLIKIAQQKFKEVSKFFEIANSTDYVNTFDWVIASGIFNIKYYKEDTDKHLFTTINKMLLMANKGISFNIITKQLTEELDNEGEWIIYDPSSILNNLMAIYPEYQVIVNYNYLDGDCTFQIFKH